jgi:hypothetical protein
MSRSRIGAISLALTCMVILVGILGFGKRNFLSHGAVGRAWTKQSSATLSDSHLQIDDGKIKFLFFMGLEGTGHHMIRALIMNSPIKRQIQQLRLEPYLGELQEALYHDKNKSKALWSLPCEKNGEYSQDRPMDHVVNILKRISQTTARNSSLTAAFSIPINCFVFKKGAPVGMMSYPNYRGACYSLQYPNVELLQRCCLAANVTCAYIYLYRDPFAMVHSTTVKRNYHNVSTAIQLYTGLYNVLEYQLRMIAPSLLLCHDYDNEPSWELGRVLGWPINNETGFHDMQNRVMKHPPPLSQQEKQKLVPRELEPYMQSLLQAHEQAKRTCLALTGQV